MRILLKREIRIEIFGSSGNCCICGSTSLITEDQLAPFWHQLSLLQITGLYMILRLMAIEICRRTEFPIGSPSAHYVLVDQLQLQSDKSGMLSLRLIRLVQVAEPSFRTCSFLLMIQSVISSRRAASG